MTITSTRRSETVLRRSWLPDSVGLLELWQHEGLRTLRTFRFFVDADLGFRPQPSQRCIAELLHHVIQSYGFTRHWLVSESTIDPPTVALPKSVAASAELLREAQAGLFTALREVSASSLLAEIAPFGVRESRAVMALGMLKHEIHHRGELYAMARVCGG
jgi:uncharacterized damage-inducible protein DinB